MSRVALLTKSDCPYCPAVRQLLQRHHVPFDELNIEQPQFKWLQVRMLEQGVYGLPAMMHDNQIVPIGNRTNKALEQLREWGYLEGET